MGAFVVGALFAGCSKSDKVSDITTATEISTVVTKKKKKKKATQITTEKTTSQNTTETADKVMKYIRYADDFIIGVKGEKSDYENIKKLFSDFISQELQIELSQEKTLITHSSQSARFLGYDVRVRRDSTVKPNGNRLQRTLNKKVELCVPFKDKIMPFLFGKSIIRQLKDGTLEPIARKYLYGCTDLEILTVFNAELRGICNYYALASNYKTDCAILLILWNTVV